MLAGESWTSAGRSSVEAIQGVLRSLGLSMTAVIGMAAGCIILCLYSRTLTYVRKEEVVRAGMKQGAFQSGLGDGISIATSAQGEAANSVVQRPRMMPTVRNPGAWDFPRIAGPPKLSSIAMSRTRRPTMAVSCRTSSRGSRSSTRTSLSSERMLSASVIRRAVNMMWYCTI